METGHPVEFAVNFQGMGLPTQNFYTYENLLKDVIGSDVSCSNDNNGVCTLKGGCSTYSQLTNYQFNISFTDATDGYYIRIPLATFAQAADDGSCIL